MNNIVDYFVPVHDPILGIKAANVAQSLDIHNWQSKAVTVERARSRHYVYLSQATSARERKRYYCVNTYDIDKRATLSQTLFPSICEALAFANQGATKRIHSVRG
ncbi:MAG: hypothetical protein V7731_16500 [Amphritea sp.]